MEGCAMKYSEKLLRIRVALSMSQEELAKELGVSFATVNRWENEHAKWALGVI